MISLVLDTAFQQGFLYVIAVFGVVISFRLLDFPDMTIDGSFTLGGAVLAVMLTNGYSIILAVLTAMFAGFIAGLMTAFLNRKLGISKILSGILIMLILYSINLRIMGKSNISLLRTDTMFTPFEALGGGVVNLFLFGIAIVILVGLLYLAITKLGLFLRATGDNEFMVRSQGVNTNAVFFIGIGFSNALIALCGAMVSQNQGFADVSMGIGMIITALAALIIGESFIAIFHKFWKFSFGRHRTENRKHSKAALPWDVFNEFFAALLGSVIYFLIIAVCLRLGLAQTDLKLATGVLVIIGISLRFNKNKSGTYLKAKL
jgi:putative ABC transport system permease protein